MRKKVAILGATGLVGQRFVQLLANHPIFELTAVAASDASAGSRYESVGHWHLDSPIPKSVANMVVQRCEPTLDCEYVFSALLSDVAGPIESAFAEAGYVVFSNASSHRMDKDVPLLIPEVNLEHLKLTRFQKTRGKIITNPNCSTIGLTMALKPIADEFGITQVSVVSMQAVSGAGYPGVSAIDILDNVIPHIKNEEEKLSTEPRKILGTFVEDHIKPASFNITAQCNRVAVKDGHMLSVFVNTQKRISLDSIVEAFGNFNPLEDMALPSRPERPVVLLRAPDAPQPRLHRNLGNGMTVSVGRLVQTSETSIRFVALVHNTIRGAAGCAVLNAEVYTAQLS